MKEKRKNPNVLLPGDRLLIPDRVTKEEVRPAGQRHRFQIQGTTLKLRLQLEDLHGKALGDAACELRVDGAPRELKTDGEGRIEVAIPLQTKRAVLVVRDRRTPVEGMEMDVLVGHMDPVEEETGQRKRLDNLGYRAGTDDAEAFRSAVEEFQCDFGLTVDGKCGPKTQAKLKEIHGC